MVNRQSRYEFGAAIKRRPFIAQWQAGLLTLLVALFAGSAGAQDNDLDFLFEGEAQATEPSDNADAPAQKEASEPSAEPAPPVAQEANSNEEEAVASPEPESAPPVRPSRSRAIEEIIVTATKRATSLQDTTIAITALSAEDLALRDISNIADAASSIPNVQTGEVGGTPQITIRGIGFNLDVGVGEPGVAVHVDNIAIPRVESVGVAGLDSQRIEVLRGPQGTIYGRNATGGSVNFVSTPPSREFDSNLTLGIGSDGRRNVEAFVTGPLLDGIQGRLYFLKDEFDGYGINQFDGRDIAGNETVGIRGALAFDLTDTTGLNLNLFSRTDEGTNPALRPAQGTGASSALGVPVPDEDVGTGDQRQDIFEDTGPSSERETLLGSAVFEWTPEWFDFKSTSALIDFNSTQDYGVDGTAQFIINFSRETDSLAFSQEFNFSGALFEDRMDWLVGAYYLQDNGDIFLEPVLNADTLLGVVTTPSGVTVPIQVNLEDEENEATAVFGEISWRFLEDFKFLVGARYSVETKKAIQNFTATTDLPPDLDPAEPFLAPLDPIIATQINDSCEDLLTEATFRSFDPKFELSWQPTEASLIYLQNQSGFKAGGINNGSCGDIYVPEEVNNTELGFKVDWLDGSLRTNGAIFHYQYDNFQVFEFNGLGAEIISAPKVSGTGAELEINYKPLDWFSLDSALSYLDAQYDEFVDEDGFDNPNLFVQTAQPQDLSGNPINRAPKYTGNLGLNFFVPVGIPVFNMLNLRAEVYSSSRVAFTQFAPEKPTDRQEPYTLYNAYASLISPDGDMQLRGFVKNISDENYVNGVFPIDLFQVTNQSYAPPRTFGLQLSYSYN